MKRLTAWFLAGALCALLLGVSLYSTGNLASLSTPAVAQSSTDEAAGGSWWDDIWDWATKPSTCKDKNPRWRDDCYEWFNDFYLNENPPCCGIGVTQCPANCPDKHFCVVLNAMNASSCTSGWRTSMGNSDSLYCEINNEGCVTRTKGRVTCGPFGEGCSCYPASTAAECEVCLQSCGS